jgi:hypothetical protein
MPMDAVFVHSVLTVRSMAAWEVTGLWDREMPYRTLWLAAMA